MCVSVQNFKPTDNGSVEARGESTCDEHKLASSKDYRYVTCIIVRSFENHWCGVPGPKLPLIPKYCRFSRLVPAIDPLTDTLLRNTFLREGVQCFETYKAMAR